MYAYITGRIARCGAGRIVIDNGGIGYLVEVPTHVSAEVGVGEERTIYTHFSVREDAVGLYGFLSEDELELFGLLITVSGVGPKGALAILSVLTPEALRFAVASGDAAAIAAAKGIGKKTAQKVILDLKDKVQPGLPEEMPEAGAYADEEGGPRRDALMAMVSLGYGRAEAAKAVDSAVKAGAGDDVGELLKAALNYM